MNRRVTVRGGHRGNDTEVHRREKENRKLQLELRTEKEKLNSTIIKYQREMTDMQAVSEPAEGPWAAAPAVERRGRLTRPLLTFFSCWRRRTRYDWSFRWRWTAKRATSSSCGASSPPSASTPWTPPASAAATTWTRVRDTQVRPPRRPLGVLPRPSPLHAGPPVFFPFPLFSLLLFNFQDCCFHQFLTLILYLPPPLPPRPLSLPPLLLGGPVGCSAHYSLPHLRIYVLHLPAHSQIGLHRHAAPPALGSL